MFVITVCSKLADKPKVKILKKVERKEFFMNASFFAFVDDPFIF